MEAPSTYGLAAAGALQGVWRYYIKPELSAPRAWAVLAAGIALYDLTCPNGQMLSEGVDRALERGPAAKAATLGLIGITALHLANAIPERYDIFKVGIDAARRVR